MPSALLRCKSREERGFDMSLEIDALMPDPYRQFCAWLEEARDCEVNDPTAMALATLDPDGTLSQRMVLLNGLDERGLVFYTNCQSRKGIALLANPVAALLFHWKSLRRQVRIEGHTEAVAEEDADAYFASRPRGSRLGAWASAQSQPLSSRAELLDRVDRLREKYAATHIPRPPHWSGFRLVPKRWEFWQNGDFRLHDRFQYDHDPKMHNPAKRTTGGQKWTITRLNP